MGAPTAGVGLPLAAVSFIGVYMQGQARPGSELPHSSHNRSRCKITVLLEPDFHESALVAL